MVSTRVPAARVIVTDAGRGSSISIIRSLGRRGWHVIAADSDRHSPGFHSRYVQARTVYPDPQQDPDAAARALVRAARRHAADLVLPVTDQVIVPLSRLGPGVIEPCRLAMPDRDALATFLNKDATVALAATLDVPTPRSEIAATRAEARAHARKLGWPVVLKPRSSRGYGRDRGLEFFGVGYALTQAQLDRQMAQLEGRSTVLVQEYYAGTGYGVELLLDRGEPVAAFQHRRLHEVPVTGGASSRRVSTPLDPQLLDYSLRLLRAVRWTGLAMVEFKIGADGPRLMEVNGRVWGSLPLAVRCGVDFPALACELYLDGHVAQPGPLGRYPAGVESRDLELEVIWAASVILGPRRYPFLPHPRRSDGVRALIDLVRPDSNVDILDPADPLPAVAEVAKLVRIVGRKAGGRT